MAKRRVVPVHKAARQWWLPIVGGVVSIAAGVLAIAYPGITLLALGIIFGVNLLLWGTVSLMLAFDPYSDDEVHRVLRALVGFIAVLAGLVLVVRPGASVLALLIAVAFWFILTGVADLARGITTRQGRWTSIVLGVIGIAAGSILLGDPDIGLTTLALMAGILFIVRGTVELIYGLELRQARAA